MAEDEGLARSSWAGCSSVGHCRPASRWAAGARRATAKRAGPSGARRCARGRALSCALSSGGALCTYAEPSAGRLASELTRVAIASRLAGLQLASESNLGVGPPELRVHCDLGVGLGCVSAAPVGVKRPPQLASRTCGSEPTGCESEPSGPIATGIASDVRAERPFLFGDLRVASRASKVNPVVEAQKHLPWSTGA
eukprot:15478365-Alexandrium_andersonii.AAC.2